jgi:hypothetical protein
MSSAVVWPNVFSVKGVVFRLTASFEYAEAIIGLYGGGPRADYEVCVHEEVCGWLKCQRALDSRGAPYLNLWMLIEKDTELLSTVALKADSGAAFHQGIVNSVWQPDVACCYYFAVSGIDVMFLGHTAAAR